jgi:hypothetical protein
MNSLNIPRLLTVDMEDYFHAPVYTRSVVPRHWPHLESRLQRNTIAMLDLLDEVGAKATFFVLGWVAENRPDLVRAVASRGHEVAAKCYVPDIEEGSFADLARRLDHAKCAVEQASGRQVFGNRFSHASPRTDLAVLEILAMKGFSYDSSVTASAGFWSAQFIRLGDVPFYEIPYASGALQDSPSRWFTKRGLKNLRKPIAPEVDPFGEPPLRVALWELDPSQPRLNATGSQATNRRFANLAKTERLLKDVVLGARFAPISKFLGFVEHRRQSPGKSSLKNASLPARSMTIPPVSKKTPITLVIPCFNEEAALPYLHSALRSFEKASDRDYSPQFIFVDDGSTDGTLKTLHRLFDGLPNASIISHPRNRGVAASILTGISKSQTEIVCSMDSDCTYDPLELLRMIPQLRENVDVVTASPYHPDGGVLNVPRWRLTLSRGSSFLYSLVLPQKLFTYTSCFRVYRRTAITKLNLHEPGYLGVAEMVASLALRGSEIREHPAVLEARILGTSKMKVLRTIAGHLRLLSRLLRLRCMQRFISATDLPNNTLAASADLK